jgi:hypothetical protein
MRWQKSAVARGGLLDKIIEERICPSGEGHGEKETRVKKVRVP